LEKDIKTVSSEALTPEGYSSALKMEAAAFSKMMVMICQTTCYNTQNNNLHGKQVSTLYKLVFKKCLV
jgi:hypothetical protein